MVYLSTFYFHALAAGEIIIPAGTRIDLESVQSISSELIQPGESVDFKVRADLFINRVVIGKIGTLVNGVLITSDYAKGIGKEGNVEVKVKSV